jgi:hypothetical protein
MQHNFNLPRIMMLLKFELWGNNNLNPLVPIMPLPKFGVDLAMAGLGLFYQKSAPALAWRG